MPQADLCTPRVIGHTLPLARDPLHEHTYPVPHHTRTTPTVLGHTLQQGGLLSALDHDTFFIEDAPLVVQDDREAEPQRIVLARVPQGG
jgi:hypothetical protein